MASNVIQSNSRPSFLGIQDCTSRMCMTPRGVRSGDPFLRLPLEEGVLNVRSSEFLREMSGM